MRNVSFDEFYGLSIEILFETISSLKRQTKLTGDSYFPKEQSGSDGNQLIFFLDGF